MDLSAQSAFRLKWFPHAMLLSCVLVAMNSDCQTLTSYSYARATTQREAKSTYYAESWKSGGTRQIQERTLKIKLDQHHASYETVLRDATNSKEYRLIVEPAYFRWDNSGRLNIEKKPPNSENLSVNLWNIQLFESDEKISLLVANRDQGDQIDEANTLAWLAPIEDPNWIRIGIFGIPISSTRVIKIDGFYCVIKVNDYELRPAKERAFERVELEIEFTNNKPTTDHK